MSDATKCRKKSRKRDRAVCEEMTRRRRVKRMAREAARQGACKAVRSLFGKVRDVSRRVRKLRREAA